MSGRFLHGFRSNIYIYTCDKRMMKLLSYHIKFVLQVVECAVEHLSGKKLGKNSLTSPCLHRAYPDSLYGHILSMAIGISINTLQQCAQENFLAVTICWETTE